MHHLIRSSAALTPYFHLDLLAVFLCVNHVNSFVDR